MDIKFFIDECLSVELVAVAKASGHVAVFGPHIGMAGWQDWNIAKFCIVEDYVIVTNNRRDFLKEFAKVEFHPGLVVIVPKGDRKSQSQWFAEPDFAEQID